MINGFTESVCCVLEVKSIILCGIETQACILQTVLDLVEKEYDVHVIADAVSSRSMVDRSVSGHCAGFVFYWQQLEITM